MIYAFSGGTDKPSARPDGIPQVITPANFDFRKIRFARISETMKPNAGKIGQAYKSGFRVKSEDLPKIVRIADADHLVDLDSDGALNYVSEGLRDLIEDVEPGIHQFEPVLFVDSTGKKIADMFTFFVCQRLDTVDRSHTTGMMLSPSIWVSFKTMARIKPTMLPSDTDTNAPSKIIISERQVGNAQIWHDKHLADAIYMSESFVDAFYKAGLTGLAKVQCDSIA